MKKSSKFAVLCALWLQASIPAMGVTLLYVTSDEVKPEHLRELDKNCMNASGKHYGEYQHNTFVPARHELETRDWPDLKVTDDHVEVWNASSDFAANLAEQLKYSRCLEQEQYGILDARGVRDQTIEMHYTSFRIDQETEELIDIGWQTVRIRWKDAYDIVVVLGYISEEEEMILGNAQRFTDENGIFDFAFARKVYGRLGILASYVESDLEMETFNASESLKKLEELEREHLGQSEEQGDCERVAQMQVQEPEIESDRL